MRLHERRKPFTVWPETYKAILLILIENAAGKINSSSLSSLICVHSQARLVWEQVISKLIIRDFYPTLNVGIKITL